MRFALALTLSCCSLCAAPAFAQARQSDIDKAVKMMEQGDYQAAARVLDVAWRQPSNRREVVIKLLELQGVVAAQLGQNEKAKQAFQALLSLDPKREVEDASNERVQKPLALAQAWAKANPALEMASEPAAVDPGTGKVMQIAVKVKADPLKLGKKVRFAIRPQGLKWADLDVELQGAYASAGTDTEGIEWYAELLGERDMVLAQVGTRLNPVLEGKAREYAKKEPVVEAPPDKPDRPTKDTPPKLTPDAEQPAVVVKAPSDPGKVLRPLGYAMLGAGVVAAAVGVYFGVQVQQARFTLENPVTDAQGNVIKPTQASAYELEKSLPRNATIANALFITGGVLAAAGGACVIIGSTRVTAGAGGFMVSGELP